MVGYRTGFICQQHLFRTSYCVPAIGVSLLVGGVCKICMCVCQILGPGGPDLKKLINFLGNMGFQTNKCKAMIKVLEWKYIHSSLGVRGITAWKVLRNSSQQECYLCSPHAHLPRLNQMANLLKVMSLSLNWTLLLFYLCFLECIGWFGLYCIF